jgi:uncharacterized protein YsxB (DUF464 family)
MIRVTVTKRNGNYFTFESIGHASFVSDGEDIVCAAVSVLTINTVNSIDAFTEDMIHVTCDDGHLAWEFVSGCSRESQLLMDSLILGLSQIQDNYDKKYLKITIKEV